MAEQSQNRERARPFGQNRRYFLGGTAIGSAKVRLSVLLLALSMAWVAVAAVSKEKRDRATNHGPIHKSHAAWIDQCDACHVPFNGEKAGIFETKDRWNTFRCETCHAGPVESPKVYSPHKPSKTKWNDLNSEDCTLCHKDHQGADFALAKPADNSCTICHANLQNYHNGTPEVAADIRDFGNEKAGHPNFKVLSKKPEEIRSLKFSHAVHMTPGQTTKWKLADIAPAMRKKYESLADASGMVALNCASCHQLEEGDGIKSTGLARQSGQVYLPVSYDKNCSACHDLAIGEKASLVNAKLEPFSVTHKASKEQLQVELNQKFLSQLTANRPDAVKMEAKPGARLDPLAPPVVPKLDAGIKSEVDRLTAQTLKELYSTPASNADGSYTGARYCLKCHVEQPGTKEVTLKPTDVHPVWLPASRFDHSKHRTMDCRGCHQEKFNPLTGLLLAKDEFEKPGIPGIDNCRMCHAPAGKSEKGMPIGGVRHACVDCHSYHNGEHPLHGPGSPFRDPPDNRRLTIEDLLRGTPKDTPR